MEEEYKEGRDMKSTSGADVGKISVSNLPERARR